MLGRVATHARPYRALCLACRVAALPRVLLRAPPDSIVAHARPCRRIVSQHTQQPGHARAHCRLLCAQAGRVVGLPLVVSWPLLRTHACCVTIQFQCIVTQTGKWAVAHSSSLHLFFSLYFSLIFFSFDILEDHQKISFFFFIFQ